MQRLYLLIYTAYIYIYVHIKIPFSPLWVVCVSSSTSGPLPGALEFEGSAQYLSCSSGQRVLKLFQLRGLRVLVLPLGPWYFSCFSYSFLMLLSLGNAMSITTASFFCVEDWLVGQYLPVCLDLEVPQELCPVILNNLLRSFPPGLGRVKSILGADVPVHDASHLVVPFSVCCSCLHFASCHYVLDCLRGVFAQSAPGILSGVVDPCFY